jgi:hypothetical protein
MQLLLVLQILKNNKFLISISTEYSVPCQIFLLRPIILISLWRNSSASVLGTEGGGALPPRVTVILSPVSIKLLCQFCNLEKRENYLHGAPNKNIAGEYESSTVGSYPTRPSAILGRRNHFNTLV